jgi:hypothetical protein
VVIPLESLSPSSVRLPKELPCGHILCGECNKRQPRAHDNPRSVPLCWLALAVHPKP